jgi:hypothetical protein
LLLRVPSTPTATKPNIVSRFFHAYAHERSREEVEASALRRCRGPKACLPPTERSRFPPSPKLRTACRPPSEASVRPNAVGSGAVNPIDVCVETNAGGVAGTMMGSDQRPAANATVVLAPPMARRGKADLCRKVTSGEDGKFTMTGLAPGDCNLFAWAALNGAQYPNPNYMANNEARGAAVSIFAGGRLSAEVFLIKD